MLQYEIAGLKLGIVHNKSNKFKRLRLFESSFSDRPDIEIKFQSSGSFAAPKYSALENDGISWYVEHTGDMTVTYVFLKETGRTEFVIEARSDWSDITILYLERSSKVEKAFCYFLGNYILSNSIIYHRGFVLHASSISYSGKGITFTAPSGTGKSTHTAMWKKYYNAVILNDDCPIIKLENSSILVYGTPWSGNKNKAAQSSSPLSMIVFLEQADRNSIRGLTKEEAIPLLLPRIFLPYQNPMLIDTVLKSIEKIVDVVPKYLLKCKPNREATELVHKCLM
ncbi:MAG TPA: hypothetical protein VHT96_11805 [Clostridia bacterium]|nr:hypothetical protein [Clostridia bacterium]